MASAHRAQSVILNLVVIIKRRTCVVVEAGELALEGEPHPTA